MICWALSLQQGTGLGLVREDGYGNGQAVSVVVLENQTGSVLIMILLIFHNISALFLFFTADNQKLTHPTLITS